MDNTQQPTTQLNAQEQQEVKVIEKIIESHEIAPQDAFGKLTRDQVELIKRTVAKGASDDELRLFIQVCKGAQLNPFLRQVHLVSRWDSKIGAEVRTIQVGIDGFRAVAESSGQYAGNDDPIYADDHDIEFLPPSQNQTKKLQIKVPSRATVTVYKLVGGQRFGFTATARWDEYYPGQKMGFQWHTRPYLMLGKCAEALALRKAFPKLLSAMYADEEMAKTVHHDVEEQKTARGFVTLMNAVKSANLSELQEYKKKMEKSTKYTDEQKNEFLGSVNNRIADLTPKKPIEDKDIPIVD